MIDADYGYWGFSPASDPLGGYREYGVDAIGHDTDGYAVRRRADQRRRRVRRAAGRPQPMPDVTATASSPRTRRSWPCRTRPARRWPTWPTSRPTSTPTGRAASTTPSPSTPARVANRYLSLDQGMIMGALGNVLANDILHKSFTHGEVRRALPRSSPWRSSTPRHACRRSPGRDRLNGSPATPRRRARDWVERIDDRRQVEPAAMASLDAPVGVARLRRAQPGDRRLGTGPGRSSATSCTAHPSPAGRSPSSTSGATTCWRSPILPSPTRPVTTRTSAGTPSPPSPTSPRSAHARTRSPPARRVTGQRALTWRSTRRRSSGRWPARGAR